MAVCRALCPCLLFVSLLWLDPCRAFAPRVVIVRQSPRISSCSSSLFVLRNRLEQQQEEDTTDKKNTLLLPYFNRKDESENTALTDESTNESSTTLSPRTLLGSLGAVIALIVVVLAYQSGVEPNDVIQAGERLLTHPQDSLQEVTESVKAMGPMGALYFGIIYLVAEILAIPATPLTLSAGYLFGMTQGVAIVLLAATIAASVAFVVGKTFLRQWVEEVLEENPQFAKIDTAIGKEGFKLLLLVRLSPIFPFALSNYLYGASSIDFASYFWGTLLGFAPGTIAYVYTGMVGKALTLGEGNYPWYIYGGGLGVLAVLLKLVADVANRVIEAIEQEEEGGVTSS